MFDLTKVKPDYQSLVGNMFVDARLWSANGVYKRFFSFVGAEEAIAADIHRYAEMALEPLTKASMSVVIDTCQVDGYDAGWVKSKLDWKKNLKAIETGYLLEYTRQSFDPRATLTSIDLDSGELILYNLCTNLQESALANSPLAQIRAEDTLREFLPEYHFQTPLEDIIRITGSESPNHKDMIDNRVRTIISLAHKRYEIAANLQKYFEQRLTGKV